MVSELTDFTLVEHPTVVISTIIKFFWYYKCSDWRAQVGEVKDKMEPALLRQLEPP